MTLTQLGAFVLVARLGSVRAAADVLGVSEPAVSKAIASLRQHLGDQLIVRDGNGMTLTEGGSRLIAIASQMVSLGAEAEAAVRAANGAPAQLRLLVNCTIAEFIATPLTEAFPGTARARSRRHPAWPRSRRCGRCWPIGWPTSRSVRPCRSRATAT